MFNFHTRLISRTWNIWIDNIYTTESFDKAELKLLQLYIYIYIKYESFIRNRILSFGRITFEYVFFSFVYLSKLRKKYQVYLCSSAGATYASTITPFFHCHQKYLVKQPCYLRVNGSVSAKENVLRCALSKEHRPESASSMEFTRF